MQIDWCGCDDQLFDTNDRRDRLECFNHLWGRTRVPSHKHEQLHICRKHEAYILFGREYSILRECAFFFSSFRSKHSPLPLYFSAYVWWSRHVPKKNAIQIAHSVGSEHWHPNERRDVKRCKMWIDNKRLGATSRIKPRHVIKLPLLHLAGPFKRISHSCEWKNPCRPMFHVCACAPPTSAYSNIVCDTFNFNVLFRSFNRNSTEIFRMNWKTFSSLQANENIEKKRNAGEEKMRNEKNKSGYYLHFQADMRKKRLFEPVFIWKWTFQSLSRSTHSHTRAAMKS